MGLKVKSSELTRSAQCAFRRERDLATESVKTDTYVKSGKIKNLIKYGLGYDETTKTFGPRPSEADVRVKITEAFEDLNFQTESTRKEHCKEATKQILRYLDSEKRVPIVMDSKELALWDVDVDVAPDLIFVDNDKKTIEVVLLKAKKPNVSMNADEEDIPSYVSDKSTTVTTNLQLYSLFAYGKDLMPCDSTYRIKASFYFLRKKNDNPAKAVFDLDFFDDEGKNVVFITEEVSKDIDGNTTYGLYDGIYEKQFEEFFIGGECSGDDCKKCDFYNICNYKLAPQQFVKEKKVRSINDLDLTEAQEAAINYLKGVARINAGAGAGKTLVVALRVVTLLLAGVKPEEICLLTFTNTGAAEMLERIQLYNDDFGTGSDVSKAICTTFNAFGNDQIIEEYDKLGFLTPPTLIDDIERASIINDMLNKKPIKGLDYRNYDMNEKNCKGALALAQRIFEIIKRENLTLGDENKLKAFLDRDVRFISLTALTPSLEEYQEYDMRLKQDNLIEYADQEVLLFQLLRDNPFYLEDMGIKHIIVDEFQDSSLGQINLIKEFMKCPSFESLMVVGDDSQAIFSFRDTTPEYIIHFDEIIGHSVDDFFLLENHRSTPEIIDFANKLNALNSDRIEKDLIATRPSGKGVVARGFFSVNEEYDYISDSIAEMINREDDPVKPEDIAFIASNKFELMKMGNILTEKGIPSVMLNPEPILENSKVIAAISLAKAFLQPNATSAIMTYLNALYEGKLLEFTDAEVQALINALQQSIIEINTLPEKAQREKFSELLRDIDDDDEVYQHFIENVERRPYFTKQLEYMKDFEVYGKNQTYKRCRDYPGVVLTTAHSSKGLEWPVVFNSISKYYTPEIKNNRRYTDEKRRLFFVSATRARDELYITGQYVAFGPKKDRTYNKFLKETYDILEMEFNPIDPMEEIREAEKKEEARIKAAERRAAKRAALAEAAGVPVTLGMTKRDAFVPTETEEKIKKENANAIAVRKELNKKVVG